MRWSLIICLLLVSAAYTKPRPKRSLDYIKGLFANKLFGSQGHRVVVAQPILAKNEAFQLYKIPGFNNILIKVNKKENKTISIENAKPVEVIVKPEVAIIGSYLGTKTQEETLLAIDMVNSLLESGILSGVRDNSVQELVVPIIPQPPRLEYFDQRKVQLPILPQEQFVPIGNMQVDNQNAFHMYPVEYPQPIPEANITPVQSIYSYKQKGPDADMTYKSYNNKDVFVTRTEKKPPLPQFLKFRIAEVATIGANPYTVRQPNSLVPYYVNPGMIPDNKPMSHSDFGYGSPVMMHKNPIMPIGTIGAPNGFQNNVQQVIRCRDNTVKFCPHDKIQNTNSQNIAPHIQNHQNSASKHPGKQRTVIYNEANNEFLKNHSVNGQLVSQYVYKQMNHHSNANYTVVRVGESQANDIVSSNKNLENYVFIPPEDLPLPSALSINNKANTRNNGNQSNDKNAFISRTKSNEGNYYVPPKNNVKNKDIDFQHHPIVVAELNYAKEEKSSGARASENSEFSQYRGDIPGVAY